LSDARPHLDELKSLRAEIVHLRILPALSSEFTAWVSKFFTIVKLIFGDNSSELSQLKALSPELPSEFYDTVAQRLLSINLTDKQRDELLLNLFRDLPEAQFRERLYEYDDLITAMINSLESSSS